MVQLMNCNLAVVCCSVHLVHHVLKEDSINFVLHLHMMTVLWR